MSALTRLFLAAVLLAPWLASPASAQDDADKVTVLNEARIYYPAPFNKKASYKKVALLDSRKVFDATPEYQEIARKNLDRDCAEYLLLAQKASERFTKAIKRTVSLGGYDLIAETGAVTVEGKTLSNITNEVLQNLATGK